MLGKASATNDPTPASASHQMMIEQHVPTSAATILHRGVGFEARFAHNPTNLESCLTFY